MSYFPAFGRDTSSDLVEDTPEQEDIDRDVLRRWALSRDCDPGDPSIDGRDPREMLRERMGHLAIRMEAIGPGEYVGPGF